MAVDPTAHRAYVANQASANVTVIDTTTNTIVGAPIPVGTLPFGVGVDPTVHRAYVTNHGSNKVTVIDTTTNVVGSPIPVGTRPPARGGSDRPPCLRRQRGPRQRDGDRHDDQYRPGRPDHRGGPPIAVGVDPTIHRAYVANFGGNTVR